MKKTAVAVLLAVLSAGALAARPQDTSNRLLQADPAKATDAPKGLTALRVQVVFNEYDGEKKISSLPYTLLVNADDKGPQAAVRMGLRVPIETGAGSGTAKQFQYMDVGTNLDGMRTKPKTADSI